MSGGHRKMVGITLTIMDKAKQALDRHARDRGLSSSMWAGQVFDIGFAAVCAREKSMPITDGDLDAICAATLLLWATKEWDTAKIAAGLGVPEATVARILDGWKQYRRGQEGLQNSHSTTKGE
jgi:hypothetical protein